VNSGGGGGGAGASQIQVGNGGGGGGMNGGSGGLGGTAGNNGANAIGASLVTGAGVGGNAGVLGAGGNGNNTSNANLGSGGGGGGGLRGGGAGGNGGSPSSSAGGGGGGGASAVDNGSVGFFVLEDTQTLGTQGFIQVSAISSNAPTSAILGSAFSYAPTTIGFTGVGVIDPGNPVWSIESGTLPAGLTLNTSTGEITGTTTTAGTFDFVLLAEEDQGNGIVRRSAQEISLTVAQAPVAQNAAATGTLPATGLNNDLQVIAVLLVLGTSLTVLASKKKRSQFI
jgi:hypothetical protein